MTKSLSRAVPAATLGLLIAAGALRGQILETETARLPRRGGLSAGGNFEYQVSAEGHESAIPFAFEYGLADRLELLVEPVVRTRIRPHVGPQATGLGDIEVTLNYLAHRETSRSPAFALAGEVKLPTARDSLIGTGKTDFAGYLIVSKRFGQLDTHANLGYTVVGHPAGSSLQNIFNFAVAVELPFGKEARNTLFGEVLANTASSSTPEGAGSPGTVVPEAAGGEIVGTVGVTRLLSSAFKLSFGVSVDNNGAVLFRPGFVIRLH